MLEFLIAVLLILLNGVFALSELAVVSSRRARLQMLASQGRAGATAALRLHDQPGRFLSAVQIGITLVAILAGAFSGAALGGMLTDSLLDWGVPPDAADIAGYTIVITLITFASVVIGELVPKHLALRNPEPIACTVAPLMSVIARLAAPAVWLLNTSTHVVLKLLGLTQPKGSDVSDEDIQALVSEARRSGVIEHQEQEMIIAVMRLADRKARTLMTPRISVQMLDLSQSFSDQLAALRAAEHGVFPVHAGDEDAIIGVVRVRRALAAATAGAQDLAPLVESVPVVPDTSAALAALAELRKAAAPMVLVHDEYGHFEGIITPGDVVDAIAGAFRSDSAAARPDVHREADGSFLVQGSMPVDELADMLDIALPHRADFHTAAGLMIDALGELPEIGAQADIDGWRFEVASLIGHRIETLRVHRRDA